MPTTLPIVACHGNDIRGALVQSSREGEVEGAGADAGIVAEPGLGEVELVETCGETGLVGRKLAGTDVSQAQGTYELDEQDVYEGRPCSISGNWYYGDYPEDDRWHFYGATVQAGYPEGAVEEIAVGIWFMAFGRNGSAYKLIWKDNQDYDAANMNYFAGEFIGDYMGDASYIAAFCTATFELQSLPLVPPMSGAPFTLTSAGTYATSEIPVERHLHVFSSDGAGTLL